MKWFWIILALVYLFSPYDIIPGFHPVGWLDDFVVMVLLYRYLSKLKGPFGSGQPSFGDDAKTGQTSSAENDTSENRKAQLPHEVLGVAPHADQQEIHAAYRKLASQYHPDKVAHLGEEFRELAEQRFKGIQEAYEKLKRS